MNIFKLIKDETAGLGEKRAVVDGDMAISYYSLISLSEKIAATLKERGVRPYHRVALLCGDSIEYIAASLAVLSISAVVVPVSVEQSRPEIDEILDKIMVDFLIFEGSLFSQDGAGPFCSDFYLSKDLYLKCLDNAGKPADEYFKINPAFIRFSSGTTGASKGVLLSHESIVERTSAADKGLNITSNDVILWVLSMSFHFVVTILLFLRRGATIVLCSSNFPESFIKGICDHDGTFIYASPFHYNQLARMGSLPAGSMEKIRLAISTAMKLPANIAEAFYKKFNLELTEAYGIIEVGLPFINLSSGRREPDSVGKVLPDYEISLLNKDEKGNGEILIRGKGMVDAYFSPWRNRLSILDNGWFDTGDIGQVDDDGFLRVMGRSKDVINFAGMKVFPYEVENVINRYPGIRESRVYGEDHPHYGQLPVGEIEVVNTELKDRTIEGLKRFCYENLAGYKVPKSFKVVSKIPKTTSGKIIRRGG